MSCVRANRYAGYSIRNSRCCWPSRPGKHANWLEQHVVAVILCDQRMPHVSGIEFLKEVRERWPGVVRIVLSGYTDSEDIIAGVNQAGIYQYLLKPWLT